MFVHVSFLFLKLELIQDKLEYKAGSVMAQLIPWVLPIPEVPGSNPVIGTFYLSIFTVNCL